tara:strand:+ start:114 stop:455 length:342 start_codon:yes stop_codon:yes gene_type:complete
MIKLSLIQNFFEGKVKLWRSFWIVGELIYGFLLLVLLQLDKYFFLDLSERSNYLSIFNLNNLSFLSKLFLILITLFISIGVWRAAENYRGSILIILLVFIYYGYRVFSLVLLF